MKKNKFIVLLIIGLVIILVQPKILNFVVSATTSQSILSQLGIESNTTTSKSISNKDKINELKNLKFDGEQVIKINNDEPNFSKSELALEKGTWEKYSSLDLLNRVGVANAMLGVDLMPTEERESISDVKPTGWKNKKIKFNGKDDYLYNRSHLIGFQLTGQNANPKNLFTGTRALNANFDNEKDSMVYYENLISKYIKETGNHVRYQVTPVFKGVELVARGIWMQAQSIEDNSVSFSVYIFNVQPNYKINYLDGSSKVSK
ncbi:DNA/RNA non-specific endonuclease [Enterococcus diestrammenae]|uniref:DNA-entry nuclease n=1 Tax=Enterococcus diestrammenae TaxID=1155073 RepID=A0ABV0F248_9ENTE|nr:DNA/RNA non-specific endonuclease [Enterococcus diestrammenae]KAF1300066.1 DNA-entry nuclease [Enterococcus diestrammenae]